MLLNFRAVCVDVDAVAFAVETLAAFVEVFLVEFAAHIVEAEFVGRDARGLTAHHGVEDAVAVFGEISQTIGVQIDRLLCRMNLVRCPIVELVELRRLVE